MITAGGASFREAKEFPNLDANNPWYVRFGRYVNSVFNTPQRKLAGGLAFFVVFLMIVTPSPAKTTEPVGDKTGAELGGDWGWNKPEVSIPTDTTRWKEILLNLSEVPLPGTAKSFMNVNQETLVYWKYVDNTEDVDRAAVVYANDLNPGTDKVFIGPKDFHEHDGEFASNMRQRAVDLVSNIVQQRQSEDMPDEGLAVHADEFTVSVKQGYVGVHTVPIRRRWSRPHGEFTVLYYAQVPEQIAEPSILFYDTPVSPKKFALNLPLMEPGLMFAFPSFTKFQHHLEQSKTPLIVFTFHVSVEYNKDAEYNMLERVMPELKAVGFEEDRPAAQHPLQDMEDELEDGEALDGMLYYAIPIMQMFTYHRKVADEYQIKPNVLSQLASPSLAKCADRNVTGYTSPLILESSFGQSRRLDIADETAAEEKDHNTIGMKVLLSDVVQLPGESKVELVESRCVAKLRKGPIVEALANTIAKDLEIGITEMTGMLSDMSRFSRTFRANVRHVLYNDVSSRTFKPEVHTLQIVNTHTKGRSKVVDGLTTIEFPLKYTDAVSSSRSCVSRGGARMQGVYFPMTTSKAVCTIKLRNRHRYLMTDADRFDEMFLRMRGDFGATTISGEPGTYVLFPGIGRFGIRDTLAAGHGVLKNGPKHGCNVALMELCVVISDAEKEEESLEEEAAEDDAEKGRADNADGIEEENREAEAHTDKEDSPETP